MNAEDRARKLCEQAGASRDPDELAEILVELRELMRQHFAHVEELIEERRHRARAREAGRTPTWITLAIYGLARIQSRPCVN